MSRKINWADGVVRMARSLFRVVWASGEVIATFSPTRTVQQCGLPHVGPADQGDKARAMGGHGSRVHSDVTIESPM